MRSLKQLTALLLAVGFGTAFAQSTDYSSWSRFQSGGHPDYVDNNSLDIHAAWCVWHEGVPLYRDTLTIDRFRQACVAEQSHNSGAAAMVNAASNNELYAAIDRMQRYFGQPANGGYKMLHYHLSWVLNHEGRRGDVLRLLDNRDFAGIRAIYESEQDHNPHVHYLIHAADNSTLQSMIDSMRQ